MALHCGYNLLHFFFHKHELCQRHFRGWLIMAVMVLVLMKIVKKNCVFLLFHGRRMVHIYNVQTSSQLGHNCLKPHTASPLVSTFASCRLVDTSIFSLMKCRFTSICFVDHVAQDYGTIKSHRTIPQDLQIF